MTSYDNFAFISYSRSDLKAASFIQSSLEHFRYPRDSIKSEYLPANSEFVREIFLDKTKLSGRGANFEQNLDEALAKSRYLFVLCSPDAAKLKDNPKDKHYVEWEINTFLRHHGGDPQKPDDPIEARKTELAKKRIIPVIVSGEPDLSDASCLPRPIRSTDFCRRNLPDMRPIRGQKLGFFGRKRTWHSAIVTLLSYVFDVERSIIFDRFTAERAKTRMRIGIAASIIAVLIFGIGCLAAYERNCKLDAAAWRHFSIAQNYLESTDASSAFGKTDLALPHLSLATRIPTPREYLVNQLLQRSWIVPMRHAPKTSATAMTSAMAPRDDLIDCPADFPLSLTNINGRISAFTRDGLQKKWTADEEFNVYLARVSPVGTVMATLRHLPAFSIDGIDPHSGRVLWSKRLNSMLRDFQFSADGRRLAILSFTGKLTILRSATGEREFETLHIGTDAQHVQFTNAGDELIVEKNQQNIICKLAKQLLEFPLSVKGMPIVCCDVPQGGTSFELISKCMTGGFATTWDSTTLSVIGTKELRKDEVPCMRQADKTLSTRRTTTGRKEVSASRSNYVAKTTDDNCVQLFEAKSQRPISESFEMPAIVKHLNFLSFGNRLYLLVGGGGPILHKTSAQGFYAVIDVANHTLLHLRSELEGQVTASFQLSDTQCLLHGTSNTRDWIITLPSYDHAISQMDFNSICKLLSGREMSENEVPVPHLTLASDVALDGTFKTFLTECQLPARDQHTSFISPIPLSMAISQLADGTLDDLDTVLDFQPGSPGATAGYWIPYAEDSIKSEFALANPDMSKYQVEQRFAAYSPRQWAEAIRESAKSIYFADKTTSYSQTCNPTSEVARTCRNEFLVFSGRIKPPQPPTQVDILQTWRTFLSDRGNDILSNPKLANDAAAESAKDKETFSSYLAQLNAALSAAMSLKDLDLSRVAAFASLLSDISVWAMDINDSNEAFIGFLEKFAEETRNAKSTIFAEQLRSQTLMIALEKSIRIGDKQRAISIRRNIERIEHADILAAQLLSFYDIFLPLCSGKSNESKKLFEAMRAKDKIMFDAMGKGIWDILCEMQRHGIDLGELDPEYKALSKQYAVGIPIRVAPGGVAEELGWKDGDAILKINGQTVTDDKTLDAILTIRRHQENLDAAKFVLLRNGREIVSTTDKKRLGIQF